MENDKDKDKDMDVHVLEKRLNEAIGEIFVFIIFIL